MARPAIVADDGDDNEPDAFDNNPDEDPEEPVDPPRRPEPRARRPQRSESEDLNLDDLLAENERLRDATQRNNRELAKRRHVEQWMKTHNIEDLDSWLANLGVDKQTGERTPPPEPTPAPAADGDLDRRLTLELEKRQAQWESETAEVTERADRLADELKRSAVEAALAKGGFNGTYEKALRVIDLGSVQVEDGDDGGFKIVGADDAVASLRTEIPDWFRPPRNGRTRSGGEDVDGGRKPPKPPARPSWEQQAIARLTGGR